MTEETMIAIVNASRTSTDPQTRQQAVHSLAEFVYTQFHQFRIEYKTEDTKGDYIVWMYPRLARVIDHFNPAKASFRTYLNWVVRLSFRTFMRNCYSCEARQRAYQTEEETRILSMEAEQLNDTTLNYGTAENPEIFSPGNVQAIERSLSKKQSEIRARTIFLLACKAGCYLDDPVIGQVAALTGYSEHYIREKLEFIRNSTVRNRDRLRACLEKQNGYYIRARRCLVEMKFFDADSARYAALEKEYRYCNRRWNDLRKGRSARIKAPSNRFLAGTLGISRGTIDSTLASAMRDGYDRLS